MPVLLGLPELLRNAESDPKDILFDEIRRSKPSLEALGIGFSVSRLTVRMKGGRPKKPPYFACCYNVGNLGDVNIVAFFYPLISDWDLMEKKSNEYRQRVRSGIREEMIHSVQVITVKSRYERSTELLSRFRDAETYYEYLLGKIVEELATNKEGQELVLTAAKLYYEDWTITSMEKLREMDLKLHGRGGYLISELIRQLVQIRIGELTSEEAKGTAWDKNRIFYVGRFGTTENLLKAMAGTLRQAAPKLVNLSPTLAESLMEIERTIQKIQLAQSNLLGLPTLKDDLGYQERARKVSFRRSNDLGEAARFASLAEGID
jgi:hypothetical protein